MHASRTHISTVVFDELFRDRMLIKYSTHYENLVYRYQRCQFEQTNDARALDVQFRKKQTKDFRRNFHMLYFEGSAGS